MIQCTFLFMVLSAPPSKAKMPVLFREKAFTCVTLAEAVNHYIALGEEAAIKELESLTLDSATDSKGGFSRKERMGWVCRILFQPQGKDPIRPPAFGALDLPFTSVSLTTWPLFPVAVSGTSYFVLSEGYWLAGRAEDPRAYLSYCRANGKFRTEQVPIPTRIHAVNDVNRLRQSKLCWKAIKWSDTHEFGSYSYSEDSTWREIKAQVKNIPAK